jgi:hypothetical protein
VRPPFVRTALGISILLVAGCAKYPKAQGQFVGTLRPVTLRDPPAARRPEPTSSRTAYVIVVESGPDWADAPTVGRSFFLARDRRGNLYQPPPDARHVRLRGQVVPGPARTGMAQSDDGSRLPDWGLLVWSLEPLH